MKKLLQENFIITALAVCITALSIPNALATELVPVDRQANRFVSALNYLSKYTHSENAEFVLAIVYHTGVSPEVVEQARKAFEGKSNSKVLGKRFSVVVIAFKDDNTLKAKLKLTKASAVFITKGNDEILPQILMVTRELDVLSICEDINYLRRGASLGVDVLDGKEKIVINLSGCKHEGVEFSSKLLSVSDVRF